MTSSRDEQAPYTELIPRPDPTRLTTEAVERATEVFRREITALRELHDKDMSAFRATVEARLGGMDQDRGRIWERVREMPAQYDTASDHFRAEVERRDSANRQLVEQRLADLDKARDLAAAGLAKVITDTDVQHGRIGQDAIARLAAEREFIMSQIEIISTRMTEKFVAIDGQFAASKTAVDAALSAAKEAVAEQNKANSAAIKVSEGNTKEQLTSLGQVSSANFKAMEDKISDARDRLTSIEGLTRGIEQAGGKGTSAARFEEAQRRALISSVISALAVLVSLTAVIVLIVRKLAGQLAGPSSATAYSGPSARIGANWPAACSQLFRSVVVANVAMSTARPCHTAVASEEAYRVGVIAWTLVAPIWAAMAAADGAAGGCVVAAVPPHPARASTAMAAAAALVLFTAHLRTRQYAARTRDLSPLPRGRRARGNGREPASRSRAQPG